jgi:hypothetical protein
MSAMTLFVPESALPPSGPPAQDVQMIFKKM